MSRKGSLMLILAVAAALVVVPMAQAQADQRIKADVPFDFIVAGKTLPAGACVIERLASEGVLIVRTADRNQAVAANTHRRENAARGGGAQLVFNRYGDRYFLYQVWMAGSPVAREFLPTRLEKELRKFAKAEIAFVPARTAAPDW